MDNGIFITQGPLSPLSADHGRLYIPREVDRQVLARLQQHEYVLLTEPHQQGVTSLLNAVQELPALHDSTFVYLDLAAADLDNSSEAAWYPGLTKKIREQLDDISLAEFPPPRSGAEWGQFLIALAKAAAYANRHVIVMCDNVGRHPIPKHTSFFGQMRVLYSMRLNLFDYNFVSFVVAGSFTADQLLPFEHNSPFNIGVRIPLRDFDAPQVRKLVGMVVWDAEQADRLAECIYGWTNGQPCLTQWFCSRLNSAADENTVDQIACEALASEPSLQKVRAALSGHHDLIRLAVEIQNSEKGKRIPFIPEHKKQLRLMLEGVIKEENTFCMIRSRLVVSILAELCEAGGPQLTPLPEPTTLADPLPIPASAYTLPRPPANWPDRIQIDFTPKSRVFPTTSSQYVRPDQFAFVTVHLNGENLPQPETTLRISAVIEGNRGRAVKTKCLLAGEKLSVPLSLALDPIQARNITTIQPANMIIRVEKVDSTDQNLKWVYEVSEQIQLQARDVALLGVEKPDGNTLDLTDNLAAWVTYRDQEIGKWLRKASDRHPEHRLVGYQGGGNDEQRTRIVREQAKAIYMMLKGDVNLQYINSTFSLGRSDGEISQRVRLPVQSLKDASANCIDGSVLFASLLMAANIEPVILLMEGHAIVGWKTWKYLARYEFVETTVVSVCGFEAAQERGQVIYNSLLQRNAFKIAPFEPGFAKLIDVLECQQSQNIYPFASSD